MKVRTKYCCCCCYICSILINIIIIITISSFSLCVAIFIYIFLRNWDECCLNICTTICIYVFAGNITQCLSFFLFCSYLYNQMKEKNFNFYFLLLCFQEKCTFNKQNVYKQQVHEKAISHKKKYQNIICVKDGWNSWWFICYFLGYFFYWKPFWN